MKRRVVITGLGAVTPLGHTVEETWQALLQGKSGVAEITLFDHSLCGVHFAAEVKQFDTARWVDPREGKRMARFTLFAMAAGKQALEDSGLSVSDDNRARIGAIVGSGIGGLDEIEEQLKRMFDRGPKKISPFFIPKLMGNAASGHLAIAFGLRGPNFGAVSACTSSANSIATAFRMIQWGDADVMFAGGSEAAVQMSGVGGFESMGALSTRNDAPQKASRPFDKNRDGFVIGEGAGVVVLEELEHAKRRKARIYAELLGIGQSDDAYHITSPEPEGIGARSCMAAAVADAGIRPERVSYINAHGTSTLYNDKTETLAIKQTFGAHAKKIAVSSTKSMIGHLLGASGGVELVVSVLSIRDQVVHQTLNYETPDPECDLDYVPEGARKMSVDCVISNSFGFGGHNGSILVGKYQG